LSTDAQALLYIPKNIELLGLTQVDIKYWNTLVETLERLHSIDGDLHAFNFNGFNLFINLFQQYEFTYNNYTNRLVNFRTDLFRSIFTLLDGYITNDGGVSHFYKSPFTLEHSYHISVPDELGRTGLYYWVRIPDKVIMNFDMLSFFMRPTNWTDNWNTEAIYPNLHSDWRAFPLPRLSDNVSYNSISTQYAIINPNSKNIEAALAYLEAFVQDPHNLIQSSDINFLNFTQKALSFYEDKYDVDLPIFGDIYAIFENGIIPTTPNPNLTIQFIDDYQRGRRTLEETIDMLQREYEMALNE
jgi:ABC-type glycerol-3-phosphate transport system substrate-binding protein